MSSQDFESARGTRGGSRRKGAGDVVSKASDAAQDVAAQARQTAADAAATMKTQVMGLLDRQVETGADMVGHFAQSAKRAADDLDQNAPQLAGLVRMAADRIDHYADGLRDQSVDDLVRAASDFTRRQPALVFGVAALAGFLLYRTVKSAPAMSAPSIQPGRRPHNGASEPHDA